MHRHPVLVAGAIVALATLTAPALSAQVQPAAVSSKAPATQALLRDLGQAEQKLLGLAEAIPEDKWGWRPAEGVRSVGEVVMHVAADNYFIPVFAGAAAPAATGIKAGDYPSVQAYERRQASKAEAVQAMRESFAHVKQVMSGTDQAFLARELDVFGAKMSGLDLWVLTTTHLHEHLGQLIAYARSNGVVPPWSR